MTGIGIGLVIVVGAAILLAVGSQIDPHVKRLVEDQEEIGTAPWELVLWVIALTVLAPLGEELLFRGLMLRGLVRRLRFWWAAARQQRRLRLRPLRRVRALAAGDRHRPDRAWRSPGCTGRGDTGGRLPPTPR